MEITATAAVAVVILVIHYAILLRRRFNMPPPPGPFGLPIVGNLPFLHPELHSYFAHLSATHGPIFRLRLGSKLAIIVSTPAMAREILRDHDPIFANRDVPAAARVIAYGGSDIVWSTYGPTWRMLRRICVNHMLSQSSLDGVYHLRRRELRAAIRHLHVAAFAGNPVDVGAEMFLNALNVITSMLWGGTVEGKEERNAVGKEFRELVGEITSLLGQLNISDFFPIMTRFDLQGIDRRMGMMLKRFDGIFARIIEKKGRGMKVGNSEEEKDLLEYMLRMEEQEGEKKTPFTMTHVKALLMVRKNTTNMEYASAAGAVVVTLLIYYAVFLRRQSTLPSLPGPFGLPIVGNLPFLHPELHSYFARLAATHGPIFRLRLGSKIAVVVSTPAMACEILRDHDHVFANRDVPSAGRVLAYGGYDIVWTPNGPTWRMLRRICVSQMLCSASLDAVYPLRRRELRAAIRHLHGASVAGDPIDVGSEMFLNVLNVITGMLWGGTVEGEEERSAVGKEFRDLIGEATALLGQPNISDFFPWMTRFDLQGIDGRMRVKMKKLDAIFARIIEKRSKGVKGENYEEGKDFLEYMLRMEEQGGDNKTTFTMTHLKALLMDMVVGGTDTSSNTVEFAMAEMMNRPETMKRAQEELDRVVGKDSIVEESHLSKLHYLSAVIKEALRLHPVLPLLVPHCPSSPAAIGGYFVPEGSRVFINVWAIHRDPTLWMDPLEFRPERFMETGGRWDYAGSDFSYLPFGSGRRKCAGIPMAERMVAYSLASLLHSFDWKLAAGAKLDLTEKFGIVLKKAEPLVAVPIPRLSLELYS